MDELFLAGIQGTCILNVETFEATFDPSKLDDNSPSAPTPEKLIFKHQNVLNCVAYTWRHFERYHPRTESAVQGWSRRLLLTSALLWRLQNSTSSGRLCEIGQLTNSRWDTGFHLNLRLSLPSGPEIVVI